jgi:hypothetical protein
MDDGTARMRRLAGLIAAEIAALAAFVVLGRIDGFSVPHHDIAAWLRTAPPEDLLAVSLRSMAILALAGLLVSSVVVGLAAVSGRSWWARVARIAVPAAVRVRLERALLAGAACTTVVASMVVSPAAARETPPTAAPVVRAPIVASTTAAAPVVRENPDPAPHPSIAPTSSAAPTTSATPTPAPLPDHHVVVPGENLWSIAASRLATASGRARSVHSDY